MNSDVELLKKRFSELARRSSDGGYFTFTDFLGLLEQSAFNEIKRTLPGKYTTFGGFEGAERIMIRFGSEDEIGYTAPFPIKTLLIKPRSERFAQTLSHRDFLGSIMNLGIERECLGEHASARKVVAQLKVILGRVLQNLGHIEEVELLLGHTKSVVSAILEHCEKNRERNASCTLFPHGVLGVFNGDQDRHKVVEVLIYLVVDLFLIHLDRFHKFFVF